jgi:hypothetical protein
MDKLKDMSIPDLKQYAMEHNIKKYSNKPKLMLINHILSELQKKDKVEESNPKKVYCGIGKLNKNQRYGTEQECIDKKEVNRYGQFKVDEKLLKTFLDKLNKKKVVVKSSKLTPKQQLAVELSGLRGKLNNLSKTVTYKKSQEFIDNLNREKSDVESKIKSIVEQLNKD